MITVALWHIKTETGYGGVNYHYYRTLYPVDGCWYVIVPSGYNAKETWKLFWRV